MGNDGSGHVPGRPGSGSVPPVPARPNCPAPAARLGIVLTATLASIGAAGVPSAGIIILIVVRRQALPPGVDPAPGIAVILGVDRILDMCRTAVNLTGDLTASAVIARSEGESLEPAREIAPAA